MAGAGTPPAGGCIIALTSEDDRYEHARRAGARMARERQLPLILYDIDAASLFNEPLPSGWSAGGTQEQYGDRLSAEQLERLGRKAIALQVREAQADGLEAYGWLPTSHGPEALAEYAEQHGARVVIMPAEREEVDPLTALLMGTRRPIERLEHELPAAVLVAHVDGSLERR